MLKIAFINTCDISGGAATAGHRLYKALRAYYDVDSRFLVNQKTLLSQDIIATNPTKLGKYIEKIIDKVSNALGLQYQWFPISSRTIKKELTAFSPDIIHIHNTHGGYFETTLLKALSKIAPIVWTLHDMWALTNNAAYTNYPEWKTLSSHPSDKNEYPQIGLQIGNGLIHQKARIYAQARLTLVTPSQWLQGLAMEAPVFQSKSVHHIPNGIDLSFFYPKDKKACREALDISTDNPVIIFSADRLSNVRKGGKDLLLMLDILEESLSFPITVLLLGFTDKSFEDHSKITFRSLGYVYDKSLLSVCISASDVLALPTHADNYPNVLVEAMSCGVPCVSYDVGGCSEIIDNKLNGYVVPKGNIIELSKAVYSLLTSEEVQKDFSHHAREKAASQFSVIIMAARYMDLYQQILSDV